MTNDYAELLARVDRLEQRKLTLKDLPMRGLKDKLETDWQPSGGLLLSAASVTEDRLAPAEAVRYIGAAGQPAFLNSWVNFDASTTRQAGFYRAGGRVYLQGLVKSGVVGSAMFVLPVGYRPPSGLGTRRFAVSANAAFGELRADDVTGGVALLVGSNAFVSLEGISFPAA